MTEPGAPDPNAELRSRALARLNRKQAFWRQFTVYVLVNTMLWIIWLISGISGGSWFPWPIFATFGWGLGVAFSARNAFGSDGPSEARIEREMRRLSEG